MNLWESRAHYKAIDLKNSIGRWVILNILTSGEASASNHLYYVIENDTYRSDFQLLNSDGQPYMGSSLEAAQIPSTATIIHFRKAVKAKYADSHLKGVGPLVYKN